MTRRAPLFAVAALVALLAGCGGGMAPSKAGGPNGADLEKKKPADSEGDGGDKATTSVSGVPGEEKEITTPDAAQKQLDDSQQAFEAATGDCMRMCKALASMQRATDHLCGLVSSDDDGKKRCDEARARVTSAEEKVKASCGGCG